MSEDAKKYNAASAAEVATAIEAKAARIAALEEQLRLSAGAVTLLRAGLETKWTDKAILGAFLEADPDAGVLGAVMAILRREIDRAVEEAETLEAKGEMELLPGPVGAARRLRGIQARLVELWQKAHGQGQVERSPRGYGSNQ